MKQNREMWGGAVGVAGGFEEGPQKVDPSTWRRAFVKRFELQ